MVDTLRKTLDLFSARERLVVAGIFCAALITALIETFSVASIMPFMAVVADPGIVERNALLGAFRGWVGTETPSGFLTALGLLVLAVLVLSIAVSAFTTWATMRFVWLKHHDLCARLFERYVGQPYAWFLDRNTAHLSKNLLNEASVVARGVLVPVLDSVVKAVVSAFILAFLVYIDPLLAGVTGLVLGGGYVALWSGVRGRQKRIGREQVDVNTARYRLAAEAFGGIKELKVLGRETAVADRFRGASRRYSAISTSHEMVSRLPRYVMEVVAFGGILLIVVYLLASRNGIGEVLPVLSAFAFGGYKLMPALQGVFAGLTTVRFHGASLDDLHADLFGEVGVLGETDRWGEPATRARRVDDALHDEGAEESGRKGEAGAPDADRAPSAASPTAGGPTPGPSPGAAGPRPGAPDRERPEP
ncbi:MAG: hypothetical protein GWM92_04730, partial [Gemmatimonadetes bacterium]|nr:hypothetical protein [Gemmatimonadota bacterium]NIR77879.1 hypothetical protein [Gemmatimonadota bacterium]NIT86424.1 hypothetical protein [Gemmatimonadota bacterium]NIU30261.1 hypothetical protein [Gemmatimonadota bacterium]NIU35165.1 hypothetical protein [Gemmatimonadota bacterium]